jgi:hypothetical protein
MGNRNPTKHYTQETKEWATGTLQNTIHRKLKNGQREPYKTLQEAKRNQGRPPTSYIDNVKADNGQNTSPIAKTVAVYNHTKTT